MSEVSVQTIRDVQSRSRLLHDEAEVEKAILSLATEITEVVKDLNPILMCIMNGGQITSGKLAPLLNFPLQMDYLHATRYRGKTSGSDLQWKKYPSLALEGRTVLLVDDMLDEGATLRSIVDYCVSQGAQKVYSAVLTEKNHDRNTSEISADFVGLQVEDAYVFGYGLDYKGYLRNAPGIYAIHESDY